MPALLAAIAVLEGLIHCMYLVLLIDLAELNLSLVLHIGVSVISTLLEILLISLKPGLGRRVVTDEVHLAEVYFDIDNEVSSTGDQNCVDEEHEDAYIIVQEYRPYNHPAESLCVRVVLDFFPRCLFLQGTRHLIGEVGPCGIQVGNLELDIARVVSLLARRKFASAAYSRIFCTAAESEALFLQLLYSACIPHEYGKQKCHIAKVEHSCRNCREQTKATKSLQ